jgi:hypothetical protein
MNIGNVGGGRTGAGEDREDECEVACHEPLLAGGRRTLSVRELLAESHFFELLTVRPERCASARGNGTWEGWGTKVREQDFGCGGTHCSVQFGNTAGMGLPRRAAGKGGVYKREALLSIVQCSSVGGDGWHTERGRGQCTDDEPRQRHNDHALPVLIVVVVKVVRNRFTLYMDHRGVETRTFWTSVSTGAGKRERLYLPTSRNYG